MKKSIFSIIGSDDTIYATGDWESVYGYNNCKITSILFGFAYKIKYWDDFKADKDGFYSGRKDHEYNSTIILFPAGLKMVQYK